MTSLAWTDDVEAAGARRRFLIGGGALVTAAALGELITPRRVVAPRLDRKLDAMLPRAFAGWRSDRSDDAPPETLAENIYDQIVCRAYVRPGAPAVSVFVGYAAAQRGLTRMHLPHGCYQSAGYTVGALAALSLPTGGARPTPAVAFSARRGDELQQVLYWSRIGERFAQSFSGQNWAVTYAALHGVVPDGVLVRLSSADTDAHEALGLLEAFTGEMMQGASPGLRRLLLG